MKSVFVIMSPGGGIGLNINDGKGTCYSNVSQAEKELESKNEWSKSKGYGVYGLVELEVEDLPKNQLNNEDPQPVQKCRVCGCTQERACPGGCYWVEPDLCSSCVDEQIEISIGYFKYADESSDRTQISETVGLACDFNSIEEAEAFIHGYVTALGLESAFENEAEKYPCQTIEFVVCVNGNYITGLEFFYEGEI